MSSSQVINVLFNIKLQWRIHAFHPFKRYRNWSNRSDKSILHLFTDSVRDIQLQPALAVIKMCYLIIRTLCTAGLQKKNPLHSCELICGCNYPGNDVESSTRRATQWTYLEQVHKVITLKELICKLRVTHAFLRVQACLHTLLCHHCSYSCILPNISQKVQEGKLLPPIIVIQYDGPWISAFKFCIYLCKESIDQHCVAWKRKTNVKLDKHSRIYIKWW